MLARWYRRHGRDLPWRRTRNPYRVLVSEIMLQQTQVSRVEAYYTRFLKQFPSVRHLATASPSMVREAWEGLGYYRRATNLHRLAREVISRRNGVIPADPAELVQLPGVGRYTAGAVASFAYERITPAVDTNVARVIRRAFHPRTGNGSSDRRIWATAAALVPRHGKAAWLFNQAIMELGAVVCTAKEARCGRCPVRTVCASARKGKGKRRFSLSPAFISPATRRPRPAALTHPRSSPPPFAACAARRNRQPVRRRDPAC
jgi:A/G-specific adenine glycosylase